MVEKCYGAMNYQQNACIVYKCVYEEPFQEIIKQSFINNIVNLRGFFRGVTGGWWRICIWGACEIHSIMIFV